MNDGHILDDLKSRLRAFSAERDWDQFHSPKNLAMALTVEAAELQEIFQWLTEAQSAALSASDKQRAADEIADVLLYLIRLADKLDIDIAQAALDKLAKNADKYPVELAKGRAEKYTAYGK